MFDSSRETPSVTPGDPPRTRRRPLAAYALAAVALLAAAGVGFLALRGRAASAGPSPDLASTRFEDHVRTVREIALVESRSVINVKPRVTPDRNGFLVADASEAQVRRYAADGALLSAFGRKGRGPGEFLRLSAALRTGGGSLVAVEMGGRLSLFDSAGGTLLRTTQLPLGPVYNAAAAGDSRVVLAARMGGQGTGDLVHVWDLRRDSLVASFFPAPAAPPGMGGSYAFAGTADAATRGDTVAAVFALADTVYLFDLRGRPLEKVAIPFRHFRKLNEPMPVQNSSIDEYRRWASTFSAISQLFWAEDGSFLVQYYDHDGVEARWRLLRMTRDGRPLFEVKDSPELLAVSGPELYFAKPGAETPASWIAARFTQ